MEEALLITTSMAVLLFAGVICSWIGKKLKVPDALLLLLAGILFGHVTFRGAPLMQFPTVFLTSVAILSLAMIVFDSTARLRLRELDTFSLKAVNLTISTTLFLLVFFTTAVHFIAKIPVWNSLLFATIVVGTSPEIVLGLGKSRVSTLLKLESIFNTPLTVILPFVVLDLMGEVKAFAIEQLIEQFLPFIMKFIVGIGTGVFIGIILFKIVQKAYTEVYSPLAVITAALLSYVLSEALGGSGVLAVTALGLFFGNVYIKEKIKILGTETVLAKALYILIFMLTGIVIKIPLTKEFFITSGLLFAVYTLIRWLAASLSTWGDNYNFSEKLYMALYAPQGIATAAVVFVLAIYNIEGMSIVADMTFAFILYSITISAITNWAASKNERTTH